MAVKLIFDLNNESKDPCIQQMYDAGFTKEQVYAIAQMLCKFANVTIYRSYKETNNDH